MEQLQDASNAQEKNLNFIVAFPVNIGSTEIQLTDIDRTDRVS